MIVVCVPGTTRDVVPGTQTTITVGTVGGAVAGTYDQCPRGSSLYLYPVGHHCIWHGFGRERGLQLTLRLHRGVDTSLPTVAINPSSRDAGMLCIMREHEQAAMLREWIALHQSA